MVIIQQYTYHMQSPIPHYPTQIYQFRIREDLDDDLWIWVSGQLTKDGHGALEEQPRTLQGKYRRDIRRAKERLSSLEEVTLTFVLDNTEIARITLNQDLLHETRCLD